MCAMEKAATDIYTFENLRKGGYSYVDKTAILKMLADDSRGRQFFGMAFSTKKRAISSVKIERCCT